MKYLLPSGILLLFLLGGCVSIPKQAPELSEELGYKIKSIQDAHLKLVDRFFDEKKGDIDIYVNEVWSPAFARELFAFPDIKAAWDHVVASNNDTDKMKFLMIVGPAMQKEISAKRLELIRPLEQLQRDLKSQINAEYEVAFSINNSLTSFLHSASKVSENRERYLGKLGLTDQKIDGALERTSNAVESLVDLSARADEGEARINEYLQKIDEIKSFLKND